MMSSILHPDGPPPETADAPPYFGDLNLDRTVASLLAGREDYRLAPLLHTRLTDADAIGYRHAVFADFDVNPALAQRIDRFASDMRGSQHHLEAARAARNRHEADAWRLQAVEVYLTAVANLHSTLAHADLVSSALCRFKGHLDALTTDPAFTELASRTATVRHGLNRVDYCVDLHRDRVRVTRYDGEVDLQARVSAVFDRFAAGDTPTPQRRRFAGAELNHVEAQILDLVARLFPEEFADLTRFADCLRGFVDPVVAQFERESQFYTAVLDLRARLERVGLSMCYPRIDTGSKELHAVGIYDIALADKRAASGIAVVDNDIDTTGDERVLVVTGPNQGGKTTFARAVGQLYHLAALGIPVPGTRVSLRLCDALFTHFEREEIHTSLTGKLEDDLRRVHAILTGATGESVVVLNETFTSTTLADAHCLGAAVIEQITAADLRCVYVTFVDALASLPATVSLVAGVDPEDPATRTYRIRRRRADGLAFAAALAAKYQLTRARITERMAS